MFKKGDKVVCIDAQFSDLREEEEYTVTCSCNIRELLNVEGSVEAYNFERFRLAEPKTPIWNNRRPKDMSRGELKAFICDRIDGVEMYYTKPTNGETKPVEYVKSLSSSAKLYVGEWVYCVKPIKSEQLRAAEKALEDAQAAVKAAQEAVAKAKES